MSGLSKGGVGQFAGRYPVGKFRHPDRGKSGLRQLFRATGTPPTSKGGGMLENAQAIADDSTTQKWPSSQDIVITPDVSGESRTLVRKSVSASEPI
jgi:hypothetical protein